MRNNYTVHAVQLLGTCGTTTWYMRYNYSVHALQLLGTCGKTTRYMRYNYSVQLHHTLDAWRTCLDLGRPDHAYIRIDTHTHTHTQSRTGVVMGISAKHLLNSGRQPWMRYINEYS